VENTQKPEAVRAADYRPRVICCGYETTATARESQISGPCRAADEQQLRDIIATLPLRNSATTCSHSGMTRSRRQSDVVHGKADLAERLRRRLSKGLRVNGISVPRGQAR